MARSGERLTRPVAVAVAVNVHDKDNDNDGSEQRCSLAGDQRTR
jgi:hypothetical protein